MADHRRLAKDIQYLRRHIAAHTNGQATVTDVDDNMEFVRLEIFPNDGYYRGAKLRFKINFFGNYPDDVPQVLCLDEVYHPNIDSVNEEDCESSNICVSLLNDWEPDMDLDHIVMALLFLLYNPAPDDALSPYFDSETPMEEIAENIRMTLRGESLDGKSWPRLMMGDEEELPDEVKVNEGDESVTATGTKDSESTGSPVPCTSEDVVTDKSDDTATEKSEDVAVENSEDVATENSEAVAIDKCEDVAVVKTEDVAIAKSEDTAIEKSDSAVDASETVSTSVSESEVTEGSKDSDNQDLPAPTSACNEGIVSEPLTEETVMLIDSGFATGNGVSRPLTLESLVLSVLQQNSAVTDRAGQALKRSPVICLDSPNCDNKDSGQCCGDRLGICGLFSCSATRIKTLFSNFHRGDGALQFQGINRTSGDGGDCDVD